MNTQEPILDSFGRKHDYLRISLTDRCNLRCFYCMPEEGIELTERENLMSMEEVLEIAKVFVSMGVRKIRLTGGEPLIRKNIEFLLRELAKLPVELAITSNGILIDRFVDLFDEIGLRKINLSLDSLDKERAKFITKRDYFDRIMSNINLLLQPKYDFDLKVNVVLMRDVNAMELPDFIEWTKDKKLSLRFIEFMPFSGNQWEWEKGVSLKEVLEQVESVYGAENVLKLQDEPNDTTRNYQVKGFDGSFGVISSVTNPFCSTCNRMRLTSNGRMKNCLFSNSETDLLTPFRAGESIDSLIRASIESKKAERAGMDTFEKLSDPERNSQNRSMIAIGG